MFPSDTTPQPVPPARPSSNQTNRVWRITDLRGVLDGTLPPERAREADHRGLSMTTYSAMKAAVTTNALLLLLDLLDPTTEGASQIDTVISLLQAIAASQLRIEAASSRTEAALSRVEAMLAVPASLQGSSS